HGFIHSIYTFDPNHIPIEFSAPVPGVDPRSNPKMKDRHPSQTALEGPDPVHRHRPEIKDPTSKQDRHIYPGDGRTLLEED
ncbi:MAG: VOC family protein, partial [Thermodesulfobacteriota bacterium]